MKISEGKETVDVCIAIKEIGEERKLEGDIIFAKEMGIPNVKYADFIDVARYETLVAAKNMQSHSS